MYYYNSAYTTYNYAAGALGILVVAVVLTALLLVLVLPKQKDGHLPAFFPAALRSVHPQGTDD